MRYILGLPTDDIGRREEFATVDALAEIAPAVETLGYHGVYVTDHPMPPARFIETGGHHALEPTVALAVVGALTSSLRLMTNLYILAYRNPFLAAKAVATLDSLTGGRVILGTGAGYLEPEFQASAPTSRTQRPPRRDDRPHAADVDGRDRARVGSRIRSAGPRRAADARAAPGPADLDRGQPPRAMRRAATARRRLDPHAGAGEVRAAGAHGAARVARRPAANARHAPRGGGARRPRDARST